MAYYGFQREKNIDKSIIDWSSITKKISDDILSVKADRDKQRSALEDTQMEQLKKVSDYTTGVDTTMNTFVMTQSQSTRDFLSSIHKQMKDGVISVDQAKRVKQSVMDTWDNVSVASKTFQDNAKRLGDAKGKGNEALLKIMGLNADLNDKKIVYDPENGQGFYVDINKKTGEVDMDTAKPVQAINAVQNQSKVYVDVVAETAALAKNAPKIQLAKSGITSVTDALQSTAYQEYLDNSVDSKLSDDERMVSVGLDYLNMEYAIDGEKGGDTTITYNKITGFKSDGTPIEEPETVKVGPIKFNSSTGKAELTEDQRKVIKAGYKNAVMGQLSRVTTNNSYDPRSSKQTPGEKAIINSVKLINKYVYDGDTDALQSALTTVKNSPYISVTKPDLNGVIQLNKSDGTYDELKTKGRSATKVGEQLAGFLKIGGEYKGRKGVEDVLNTNVLTTKSSSFTQRYSLSPTQEKEFVRLLSPTVDNFDTPVAATEINIKQAVTKASSALGIPSSRITVVKEDGSFVIRYSESDNLVETGRVVGTVGVDSPNQILENLENMSTPIRSKGGMSAFN
jgi:hypothetical protein